MTTTFFWPDVDSILLSAIWPLLNLLTFCLGCDFEQSYSGSLKILRFLLLGFLLLAFGDVLAINALSTC